MQGYMATKWHTIPAVLARLRTGSQIDGDLRGMNGKTVYNKKE